MAKKNTTTRTTPAQSQTTLPTETFPALSAATETRRPLKPAPDWLLQLEKIELPNLEFLVDDLDAFVDGTFDERVMERLDLDGCYILGFLSHVDWWLTVAARLAECLEERTSSGSATNVRHQEFKRKLRELEIALFSRFPDAHLAEPVFLEYSAKPKMELLKAYRALTLFLSSTAEQLFPDCQLHSITTHA